MPKLFQLPLDIPFIIIELKPPEAPQFMPLKPAWLESNPKPFPNI